MLQQGQICSRKQRSDIDRVTRVFNWIQEDWEGGKLTGMLPIDMKGAFDYASQNYLLRTMEYIGSDIDLMR